MVCDCFMTSLGGYKKIVFYIVSVVVVGFLAAWGILGWSRHQNPSGNNTPPPAAPTLADTTAALKGDGKIVFPPIVGASTGTFSGLSKSLTVLMGGSLTNIRVNALTYRDGRKGFLVHYEVSNNLDDAFTWLVRPSTSWKMLYAARADAAALYQAEDSAYEIQALLVPINNLVTSVDIQGIQIQK